MVAFGPAACEPGTRCANRYVRGSAGSLKSADHSIGPRQTIPCTWQRQAHLKSREAQPAHAQRLAEQAVLGPVHLHRGPPGRSPNSLNVRPRCFPFWPALSGCWLLFLLFLLFIPYSCSILRPSKEHPVYPLPPRTLPLLAPLFSLLFLFRPLCYSPLFFLFLTGETRYGPFLGRGVADCFTRCLHQFAVATLCLSGKPLVASDK
ncbi:hypothetical protein MAPG_10032 [Magnaporthiopsis poae ATCC 64411]|uniref:Uncharacterized protein n=1 Tax=Magnaporthiopsis poae (strain ATCC 64411 / 73-15) TaxID=644358 RepID=A0A0C4EBI3_MAGP6|nr:hypothetical protein MAPG_10032 [Magnaporthiopsis poae ATCC 64411]